MSQSSYDRFLVRAMLASHPAYNPLIGLVLCIFLPIAIAGVIYQETSNLILSWAAGIFTGVVCAMLEAILIVGHEILKRLPPKQ